MTIQLTHVISDLTGMTGMSISRAMVEGERDPGKLAQERDPRCASSDAEMAQSLAGHDREEHRFALQQAREVYDFDTQQIRAGEAEIERN